MTARDYEAKFFSMYKFVSTMGEEALARRFEDGLNSKIRMLVTPLNLGIVAEVLHQAIICEQQTLITKRRWKRGGIIKEKGRLLLRLAV